jgi:IS1 family transposase
MNTLSMEKQIMIASMLVEGNSIRSIERVTQVHRDTIMRLGIKLGERANYLSSKLLQDIKSNYVQLDEIWAYVGKKNKNLSKSEKRQGELGDQYIFVALDAETKLVPHFEIGKRTLETATSFIEELSKRIVTNFQLSTDSFPGYSYPIETILRRRVDYAQIQKIYREDSDNERRYSPGDIIRIIKKYVLGNPDFTKISTSYVERQNLTMRMQMRRLTRLTNAFSKKLYNLQCAVALHFFYYNFMRIHQSLRVTPAMEAGVTNHLWDWNDFLGLATQFSKVA